MKAQAPKPPLGACMLGLGRPRQLLSVFREPRGIIQSGSGPALGGEASPTRQQGKALA